MIVEDFVMLGTTVPEPSSDGRVMVCSAGFSYELRAMLRVYPLARAGVPRRWGKFRVPLERNPKDSRAESWKIAGDRSVEVHSGINERFESVGSCSDSERDWMLGRFGVESIQKANERRLSLAIIQQDSAPRLEFDESRDSPDSPQLRLFDGPVEVSGAKRFPYIPRLSFEDQDGAHRLMLRDWGVYEFMRKNPHQEYDKLAGALRLSENRPLLVGNMSNQRMAWLVISVLKHGVSAMQSRLDLQQQAA